MIFTVPEADIVRNFLVMFSTSFSLKLNFSRFFQRSYSAFIEGLYRFQTPSTLVLWNIQSFNVAVRVKTAIHTHDLASSNINFF